MKKFDFYIEFQIKLYMLMETNNIQNNFIDVVIGWIKQNYKDSTLFDFVNKINKKSQNNNIIWYNSEKNKILIDYNYKENKYRCVVSKLFYSRNLSSYDIIIKSDYSNVVIEDKYISIYSEIPDFICMGAFLLKPSDLSNIKGSLFYKNYLDWNNQWIKNLLESKSYSLIISIYTGKNLTHYELSMYRLLQTIYEDSELFDLGVRYLILKQDNLEHSKIEYLDSYIKSKSIINYTFMHKYILKTPDFVIKKILQIEKYNNEFNYYRIRYEEKNFIIKFESNNFTDKFEYTNIIWLHKIFITDEVDEYEYNIFNLYLNKTNGSNLIDQVIFYEHLSSMIFLSNYFIDWANKNINSWHKINPNDLVTLNYSDWVNKYFGGNINDYLKN
jgi:hypothetical protein